MSAQPIDQRDPADPAVILATLPDRARGAFLREYEQAARAAVAPEHFAELRELLLGWSVRAVAYSAPGFWRDREAAVRPADDDVTLDELNSAHGLSA